MYTPKELTFLGVAIEASWGVAVDPVYYIPHKDFKPSDEIEIVRDAGIRGSMAGTYNVLQGTISGSSDISGEMFPDSFGLFLATIMGNNTVSGGTSGYETGATGASANISGGTDNAFKIAIDGDLSPKTIALTLVNCDTGAHIAAEMQNKIRSLGGAYAAVAVIFVTDHYKVTSASFGATSKVRITAGDSNDVSVALKIGAANGAVDTDGTGAPLKTHTFKLARTTQPPSLTLLRYDGTNTRQWAGHMAEELSVKWADKAALEYSYKSKGKKSVVATTPTPTTTATYPFVNWNFSLTLGGSASMDVIGFDASFKRKLTITHSARNSQDPGAIIAGPLTATGKVTFLKSSDAELNFYLNNTQQEMTLTGTQAGTNYGIVMQFTKMAFTKAPVTAKEVMQVDVEFEGIDNVTDGGPALVRLVNEVATY